MEVNASSIGWPGLIEATDESTYQLLHSKISKKLIATLREIDNNSLYENKKWYFQKHIESLMQQKNKTNAILLARTLPPWDVFTKECGIDNINIQYASPKEIQEFLKTKNKKMLDDSIILNHGYSNVAFKEEQLYERLRETYNDNFIDSSDAHTYIDSKLWYRSAPKNPHFWDTITDKDANTFIGDAKKTEYIEKNYIAKEYFSHCWSGVHIPGTRSFSPHGEILFRDHKYILKQYLLQRYYQLPHKLTLHDGNIDYWSVDLRAYVTIDPFSQDIDMQLFGREWVHGRLSNVSSWWNFAKVITVPDPSFLPLNHKIRDSILSLTEKERSRITGILQSHIKERLRSMPDTNISPTPFLLSESGYQRAQNIISSFIEHCVQTGMIWYDENKNLTGVLLFGVDIAINPLPQ